MVCKSWKDFSGFEQLSNKIRDQACVGKQKKLVEVHLALKSLKALLKQSSYIFWAQTKLKKLAGFAKIWAGVVSGIGLIYREPFVSSRPSSQVGNTFQLYGW